MGLETKISILSIIVFEIKAIMYVNGDIFKMAISRTPEKCSTFCASSKYMVLATHKI